MAFITRLIGTSMFKYLLFGGLALGAIAFVAFQNYQINSLENDLKETKKELSSVQLQHQNAVNTANKNADKFSTFKEAHEQTLKSLDLKHKAQLQRAKEFTKITERIVHVKNSEDGAIAPILNSTLNSLQLYQNSNH
ncbi:MAG: hypothetical protein GQ570_10410 [Helicobacteraceae bacterium]|nr:hypothetical protein [Helicobacteraceae bacterium]